MSQHTPPLSLTDEKLDRLEELLDDPALEDSLRLDEAQGYLCAALTGPSPMLEEQWLADILGSEEALETSAGKEAAELLREFAQAMENTLVLGEAPELLLYPVSEAEDSPNDYQPWCQAYLAGIDAAEEDWFEFLGDEEEDLDEEASEEIAWLDAQLFPLMVLTGDAEAATREHGEDWPQGEKLEEIIADCEEELPQSIADIFLFWQAKRGVPTLRRDEAKVGRNDPCPCGSGKKFKQCCAQKTDD